MRYLLKSLYLCVTDMERAIKFYETLLDRKVTKKDAIYSVFDIEGFRLGLFAFEKMGEPHSYGNNCLPSIEVERLSLLKEKLDRCQVVFPLTRIGTNWVAEIIDSEGNQIELTTPLNEY